MFQTIDLIGVKDDDGFRGRYVNKSLKPRSTITVGRNNPARYEARDIFTSSPRASRFGSTTFSVTAAPPIQYRLSRTIVLSPALLRYAAATRPFVNCIRYYKSD